MFALFLILLALSLATKSKEEDTTICSCNGSASEAPFCCHSPNRDCPSQQLNLNDSVISICSDGTLSKKLVIRDAQNISIVGGFGNTVVMCIENKDTGIEIFQAENIEIANIEFSHCGALYNSTSVIKDGTPLLVTSALHVEKSTNIRIRNVRLIHGNGTGLIIIDSQRVSVTDCLFEENKIRNTNNTLLFGGGGIYIDLKESKQVGTQIHQDDFEHDFLIENCTFLNNSAWLSENAAVKGACFTRSGRGGGIVMYLRGKVNNINITLNNVTLTRNKAFWGGGIDIHICEEASSSHVYITNSRFKDGNSAIYAGGGLNIGFAFFQNNTKARNNSIRCEKCTFENNEAQIGGGMALYSAETDADLGNSVTFKNCKWHYNRAQFGSGVDVAPQLISTPNHGYIPRITFIDATFKGNFILKAESSTRRKSGEMPRLKPGKGAFLVTGMTTYFKGNVDFVENNNSAIYAISSVLDFGENSKARFINNSGLYGGAISLVGFATIRVHKNVNMSMINNTASTKGGAIYHQSIDKHDYVFSHSCLIQLEPSPYSQGNRKSGVLFNFTGNQAGNAKSQFNDGNSIFTTTMLPCFRYCSKQISTSVPLSKHKMFSCIGEFIYDDINNSIATSGTHFKSYYTDNNNYPLPVIPGKKVEIPFRMKDDFEQNVSAIYHVTTDGNGIVIEDTQEYTSENLIILKGKPGTTGNITITKVGLKEAIFSIEVKLNECPPFFKYTSRLKACSCAGNISSEYSHIRECNYTEFVSDVIHGFWVGYNGSEKASNFMYGHCPDNYCYVGKENERYHTLPSNNEDVDKFVCGGSNRTGILCGKCLDGFSALYHSNSLSCGSNKTCKYGWFLYILSEIVPLIVLFIIVMVFNINFTSGYLNGFLFYAQVFDSTFSTGKSFIYYPEPVHKLTQIIQVFYKLFNFDFFGIDSLSFCLWEGAKTLDMLAFKFVTVAFALLLIVITVFIMNRCVYNRWGKLFKNSLSIIHGLSAFLVMVYAQCTKISFHLLNFTKVKSLNGNHMSVLFHQGNIEFFSNSHKPYAALALICLLTLTTIPPLFLISYPLCYKLSSLLRLQNTLFSKALSKVFPISKLKPIFDSFQGSFKDRYRYFAGLYFLYRVGLLAAVLFNDLHHIYTVIQLSLIVMLTIHCFCWPYKRLIHNRIDAFILSNLTITHSITIFNYLYGKHGSVYQISINVMTSVQLIFIYAPCLYFCGYVLTVMVRFFMIKLRRTKSLHTQENEDILMERIDSPEYEEDSISIDYKKLTTDINN